MAKSNKKKSSKKKIKTSKKGFWQDKHLCLPALALVLFTFLIFSGSMSCDFVNWDDDVNIMENASVLNFEVKTIFTEGVIGGYNPLTTFFFAVQKQLFGLNPSYFHLTNVLLHLGCTFLVYRILLLLGLSRNAALLAAALFGIHPMRVESVTWVTELKDVLFGVFYLAALFLYTKAIKNKTRIPHEWIIPLFILSLFSKIQAVSLPLSMLAVDYYFQRKWSWTLLFHKAIYFLLSLAVGVLGIVMLSNAETINDDNYYGFLDRILIGIYSLVVYLIKAVIPYKMSPLYPYPYPLPWQVYATPVVLLVLGVGVYWAYRKQNRAIVFAVAFFIVNIMFMLQVLGAGQGFLADRFTYIPYIGIFFLFGFGYDFFIKNKVSTKAFLPYVAMAFVALMSILTFRQIKVWKDSESLWLHVIKFYPDSQRPYGNLAHHYRENGNYDAAIKYYSTGIEKDKNATIFNGRGKSYFDKAITSNPRNPDQSLVKKAIADYTQGIAEDPSMAEIRINRGAARASIGQYDDALQDLTKGLEQEPDNANGYHNRSLIYSLTGQPAKAIADHDSYLRLRPNNADIYYERATAKARLNRVQEAVDDLSIAIQLKPNEKAFYIERSKAYKALGEVAKSNADYERAQQLR